MSMRGMDGAARRRAWMMMIVEMVRKDPGVTIDRIQAQISWRTGLSYRRISEYVEVLVQAGQLKEEGQGFVAIEKR